MARKSRRRSNNTNPPGHYVDLAERDLPRIATAQPVPTRRAVSRPPDVFIPLRSWQHLLREIEDLRTWHPDPVRPAASWRSPRHRLSAVLPKKQKARSAQGQLVHAVHPALRPGRTKDGRPGWAGPPVRIGFAKPLNLAVCVRRAQRREVLFAKSKGRGPGRPMRPRKRNRWSNYSCR